MSLPEPQPGPPQGQSPNGSGRARAPAHLGSVPVFAPVNNTTNAAAEPAGTGPDANDSPRSLSMGALVVGAVSLAVVSTAVGGLIGYLSYSG